MIEKLDEFKKFKRASKKISREQQIQYPSRHEKAKIDEDVLFLLDEGGSFSSDESFDRPGSKRLDYLKRQRILAQKKKEGKTKITFDF